MGSFIETNDTLQITREQGFPKELEYENHIVKPYLAKDFENIIFEFKNKPNIRIYHRPPVRNFLVENINGKWLYWGLVHILEVGHDYVNGLTSGKYKIIYINTPDEMKHAHNIIDRNQDTKYV
ncbi:hypothetical protein FWC63_01185 [Candidatus Saccharibacteria bacterium]|nr:hypothetical protein [Candidatus Saccharibacteria bacterium]